MIAGNAMINRRLLGQRMIQYLKEKNSVMMMQLLFHRFELQPELALFYLMLLLLRGSFRVVI
jgi:hypothetical protein